MSNETNPAVEFIEQLIKRLFDAIIRGDYNYDRDMKSLIRYREQAQKLDHTLLEARVLNIMGILCGLSGRSDESEQFLLQIVEIYKTLNDTNGLVAAYGNLYNFNVLHGRYEIAYDYIERALALKTEQDHLFLLSNKMTLLLFQDRYDEIEVCYEEVKKIAEKPIDNARKDIFARFMSSVYRTMAEVHIYRQQQEEAVRAINMAHGFAQGLNLTFELADIYYTYAHIALSNHDKEQAEIYWSKAHDVIKDTNSPLQVGRDYLEEAQYLKRKGFDDKSEEFARYAFNIFEEYDMPADLELAKQLFAQTSTKID